MLSRTWTYGTSRRGACAVVATLAIFGAAGLLPHVGAQTPTTSPTTQPAGESRTLESGLQIIELGSPSEPQTVQDGDTVWIHYTGQLENGQVFDTSLRPRPTPVGPVMQPLMFTVGQGQLIPGFEQGVQGMTVGDKRRLVIPPDLGYGAEGRPPVIPPNSTLVFDIELVGLYRPETAPEAAPQPE